MGIEKKMDFSQIHLASGSAVKARSVVQVFPTSKIIHHASVESGVSVQPMSKEEIMLGAQNRLGQVTGLPAVSLETGIFFDGDQYFEITFAIFNTRLGQFSAWSNPLIHDQKCVEDYKNAGNFEITVEEFAGVDQETVYTKNRVSRCHEMAIAVQLCFTYYLTAASALWKKLYERRCAQDEKSHEADLKQQFANAIIPADESLFKDVPFLNIQYPFGWKYSSEMVTGIYNLTSGLLFNTVVPVEARGFLFLAHFTIDGRYSIVLARKPGKLPGDHVVSVKYGKEYEQDEICIMKDFLPAGSKVVVIDDVVATGGSFAAIEELVNQCGATVEAFLTCWAIVDDENQLMCKNPKVLKKLRFLFTQRESIRKYEQQQQQAMMMDGLIHIHPQATEKHIHASPPGVKVVCHYSTAQWARDFDTSPIIWGRFPDSMASNVLLPVGDFENKHVIVMTNLCENSEVIDLLRFLEILYRKEPSKITIFAPFIDHATQDRIGYHRDKKYEELAQIDCVAKLFKEHQVITYDIHAEQSKLLFSKCKEYSVMELLWQAYCREHSSRNTVVVFPDDGAKKRFSKYFKEALTTVAFSKVRDGDERKVGLSEVVEELKDTSVRVVIADDLTRSGGTLHEVAKFLKTKYGTEHIDAMISHAPLTPQASGKFNIFSSIWTTDSCPKVPREWVKLQMSDVLYEQLTQ